MHNLTESQSNEHFNYLKPIKKASREESFKNIKRSVKKKFDREVGNIYSRVTCLLSLHPTKYQVQGSSRDGSQLPKKPSGSDKLCLRAVRASSSLFALAIENKNKHKKQKVMGMAMAFLFLFVPLSFSIRETILGLYEFSYQEKKRCIYRVKHNIATLQFRN